MARRGGLGRGLDSLIPNKNSGKKGSDQPEKPAKHKDTEEKRKKESVSAADDEKIRESEGENSKGEVKAEPQDNEGNAAESEESGIDQGKSTEIIPGTEDKTKEKNAAFEKDAADAVINMRISRVEPNRDQPRKYFDDDAIAELADSIRQFGVIQPLLVQEKDGYYEIIAGERRWRAAKLAGLKEIPVIVKNFSNQEAVEISLIENIQREDLNPIEEAKAYERLVSEFGLSQEAVAGRVSKSRSAVANSMRLLRLDESIQKMVEEGLISEGHARALLSLSDPAKQKEVAERIVKETLSVRQTEKIVRELTSSRARQQKERDVRREAILQSLSESLKSSLQTKVTIKDSGRHKGKIEIEYYSDEELERLTDILKR